MWMALPRVACFMHKLRRLIQPGGVLAHRYSAVSLSPPGYLDA